jgi:hypothetical protein
MRTARALVTFGLLALGACSRAPEPKAPASASASRSIAWRAWDASAFDDARREGKLVLVDVGIEGCTACRWMYEETYRDPAIVESMRAGFVAIAVDADVQPDLGTRFEEWGWPATIVMTPDGERVLALRGSRSPQVFAGILDELAQKKRAGTLHASNDDDDRAQPLPPSALHDACVSITRRLDADRNDTYGGWTDEGPQFIQGPAIEEAFFRASIEARPDLRAHALKTLDGWAKMLDPEWGGVYVAAHDVDFGGVIVEKRLVQEAEALRSFAIAYAATREPKHLQRASEIDRYLASFLLAPDGTFYSTQQDEAPNLPHGMTTDDYFRLPDKGRRKLGVPPVDHAVYTDQNAQAIEAYAKVYEATGEPRWLERATRAADAILATRFDASGRVRQAAPTTDLAADTRKRAFRPADAQYLTAQAHFGAALLALHGVTGEGRWLESAKRVLGAMRTLEDPKEGGFFASTTDKSDKPAYENVVAARALHRLGVYTDDATLDAAAVRAILGAHATRGAVVALAAQEIALGPIAVSVAGSPDDSRSVALYRAALGAWHPRKVVHFDVAHKYPVRAQPAAYVCTHDSCSSPIVDPSRVAVAIAAAAQTRKGPCD